MKKYDVITGKINEAELDLLVDEDNVNGAGATAIVAALIAGAAATFSVTMTAGGCPTSACTNKCNK